MALAGVTGKINSAARAQRWRTPWALCIACLACAALLGLCSPAQAATTRSGTLHATVIDNHRVLVKYRRSGGLAGDSVRLVVARNGNARLATPSGSRRTALNRKLQSRLTRTLRRAHFARLKPSYQPATPVPDAFTHTVTHHGHTVRAVDTAAPRRLQAVIDILNRIILKLSRGPRS